MRVSSPPLPSKDVSLVSDTPIPPLLDNDSLNESERQLIEAFERRGTASTHVVDDVSLTSAEDLEDTDTPGSETPDAAPGAPSTVEGPSGAPVSDQVPTVPPTEPPVAPPVVSGDTPPVEGEVPGDGVVSSPVTPAFTFAGVDYTPEDLSHAVQVQGWYNRLNDHQLQSIDAMLSGQYVLVPANAPVTPPTGQQPVTPPVAPSPAPDVDEAGEWLDPRAQAEITALRNQLTEIQQTFQSSLTPLVQQQQDVQLQQRVEAIGRAESAFQTQYTIPDDTFKTIQQSVVQAGILPSLVRQHNGDIESATRQAYEMMFWTTPSFREAHIGKRAASDLAEAAKADQDEVARKKKLTALAPTSGGSVPRPSQTKTNTRDDRHAGMVELIRADLNGV